MAGKILALSCREKYQHSYSSILETEGSVQKPEKMMSKYLGSCYTLTGGFSSLPSQRGDGELTRVFMPQGREGHKS